MKQFILSILFLSATLLSSMLSAQEVTVRVLGNQAQGEVKARIEQQAAELLTAFNQSILEDGKKIKEKLRASFDDKTPESKELIKSIMELWEQSPINCSVEEVESPVLKIFGGGYQMRDIPVNVLDADMNNSFQDLVLSFDGEGKLREVNMALEKHNYNKVILEGIPEEDLVRRQMILDFVEVFRTAYNRKDLTYLKQVYSDDALIITGTMLKKKKNDDSNNTMLKGLGGTQYELVVQNKKQYIEKLSKIFSKNSYINIKFEDVSVEKSSTNDRIYGVTLKQFWNTSTYSDVGWLFLLINFDDPFKPSIEVRTWQPHEFEGRTITRDEVFTLDNFKLN